MPERKESVRDFGFSNGKMLIEAEIGKTVDGASFRGKAEFSFRD